MNSSFSRLALRVLVAIITLVGLLAVLVVLVIPASQRESFQPLYANTFKTAFTQRSVGALQGAAASINGCVSDDSGAAVTALVRLYNARRRPRHIDLVSQSYTDLQGRFELDAAPGDYELFVYKGPEYEYFIQPITVTDSALEVEVALHQIADMAAMGWFAGDPHQHSAYYDGQDEVADLLRYNTAVGLHFSVQTDHNKVGQNVVAQQFLASTPLAIPGGGRFLAIGGDEVSTSIGHMIAWEPKSADGEYIHIDHSAPESDQPMVDKKLALDRMTADFGRYALFSQINHPGGGTRAYEHFGEKRGDSFMDVDFDWVKNKDYILRFDATESWNGGSGFMRSMYHFGSSEVHPFEAMERVFHEWFRLLNTGARLPSLGSSDTHDAGAVRDRAGFTRMVSGVRDTFFGQLPYLPPKIAYPLFGDVAAALMYQELDFVEYALEEIALLPGSPRTYVYTGGELSAAALAENVGHSFITSGPLLLADVDGAIPGQAVSGGASNVLNMKVTSHKPLRKLMVIVDGELRVEEALDNVMRLERSIDLDLRGTTWLLVYVEGQDNYAYAFTNPIYIQ